MRAPPITGRFPTLGFVMVETLIVVALLGFAMLSNIALLVESLRVSRNALYRTTAVTLAADLSDRIRSNRTGRAEYALNSETVFDARGPACGVDAPCDAAALAQHDLSEWQQSVLAALPNARTSVRVDPVVGSPASLFTIEIRWTPAGDPLASMLAIQLQA